MSTPTLRRILHATFIPLLFILLVGCSHGSSGGGTPSGSSPSGVGFTVTPSSLSLVPSSSSTLTVQNTGLMSVQGLSISVNTLGASLTITANTCGPTLGVGQSCTVTVQAVASAPPGQGRVTVSSSQGSVAVPVSIGLAPDVALSSSANTLVLIQGANPTAVTFTNVGASVISQLALGTLPTGVTAQSSCPALLAPNAACTVTFQAASSAPLTAAPASVLVNSANEANLVPLTVQVVAPTPPPVGTTTLTLPSPLALNPGQSLTWTLTNQGPNALAGGLQVSTVPFVSGLTITADTSCTNLAANATCPLQVSVPANTPVPQVVQVTLTSANAAPVVGALNLVAPASAQLVTATPLPLTLLPGAQTTLVLSNNGTAAATNVTLTGLPSGVTANPTSCGTINVGQSCTLVLTAASGIAATNVTLTAQGENSNTLTLPLSISPLTTTLTASPSSVTLNPGQSVALTVNNTGPVALSSGLTIGATPVPPTGLSLTPASSCTDLAVNQTCTVTVALDANATVPFSTQLSVGANNVASPAVVTVTGQAVGPTQLSLTPATATLVAGSNTTFTLTNQGDLPAQNLAVSPLPSGITATLASSCADLAPNATCTLSVNTAPGAVPGVYTLTVQGTNTPAVLASLQLQAPMLQLAADPTALALSPGQSPLVQITANGNTTLTGSLSLTPTPALPSDMTATLTGCSGLNPQGANNSCSLQVSTSLSTPGYAGTLIVTGANIVTPLSIPITVAPTLAATPSSLVLEPGTQTTLTVTNTSSNVTLSGITLNGLPQGVTADVTQCPDLTVQQTCVFTLTAASTAPSGTTNLRLTSSTTPPLTVPLTVAIVLSGNQEPIALSSTSTNATSAQLTLTNTSQTLTVDGALQVNQQPAGVTITPSSQCTDLGPQQSCNVTFSSNGAPLGNAAFTLGGPQQSRGLHRHRSDYNPSSNRSAAHLCRPWSANHNGYQ